MTPEEFARIFPHHFGFYAEDPSHPLTSDRFASGRVCAYHSWQDAKVHAKGEERVFLIANVGAKPLVLDTAEKFLVAWKASGGDCVTGPFRPDQAFTLADWAEAYHYDAVVIPVTALQGKQGSEVVAKVGVAQTIILRPFEAADLGAIDQITPIEIHRRFDAVFVPS